VNSIEKALRKLAPQEQNWVEEVVERLISGKTEGLNIKKLRGYGDVFRIRKGQVRVIYTKKEGQVILLFVGRRNESTYSLQTTSYKLKASSYKL
jgi:mRNA-degrading endonuclease RelE of RelBE toxin-antitoxin system